MSEAIFQRVLKTQRAELTEHLIYARLAAAARDPNNRKVLYQISNDELRHHGLLEQFTQTRVSPGKFRLWAYYLLARVFGLTFTLKLMERGNRRRSPPTRPSPVRYQRPPISRRTRNSMNENSFAWWTRSGCTTRAISSAA